MKHTFLSALVLMFVVTLVSVNTSVAQDATTEVTQQQEEKKPVKAEELPEAVKAALASADYTDWQVSEAFSVKKGDAEYFEINLKNGDQTKTAKLDKDGKKVE